MKFRTTLLVCMASIALVSSAGAFQMPTTRVSVSSSGVQGNANSYYQVAISADGRFVAFSSQANNLVVGDTNWAWDVFVHDRANATTECVSVDPAGKHGNAESHVPSISADGRFVAFQSYASDLVAGDTNGGMDIFVRDRSTGVTERVSVSSSGAYVYGGSFAPSISADGRIVAFGSWDSKLVADVNPQPDMFVRDRLLGTTELVSVSTGGVQGNGNSAQDGSAISGNGRFVAFGSQASNLVPGDTNNGGDVFVRDRLLGTTERASVSTAGTQGNSVSIWPSVSADGRFVAFTSLASDLVAGDTNMSFDVFVRDRQNGTTERVSVATGGAQGNRDSYVPSISADGRFVSFTSSSSSLVAGDTNNVDDVFVRDRLLGTTERVSLPNLHLQAEAASWQSAISADGRFVAFQSQAATLVVGDTNGKVDTFVRDRVRQPARYCTSATSSNGCSASVAASGNPSVSLAYACNLTVSSVDGQRSGILFYGIDNSAFTPLPWAPGSTSLMCVKQPTQRTSIQTSGGTINACDGSFALDWNAYQAAHPLALGNPWSAGAKAYVQAWFRDPPAVKSTNLSDALEMTYVP